MPGHADLLTPWSHAGGMPRRPNLDPKLQTLHGRAAGAHARRRRRTDTACLHQAPLLTDQPGADQKAGEQDDVHQQGKVTQEGPVTLAKARAVAGPRR